MSGGQESDGRPRDPGRSACADRAPGRYLGNTRNRRLEAQVSAKDRKVIQVSQPVYLRLTAIQNDRQALLKRQVSYSEVIEQLLPVEEVSAP